MNVFDYAMQMEKDGEAYYRDLIGRCNQEGIKRILSLLADDEVGHYNAFKKLKEESSPEVCATTILGKTKTIFAEMRGQLEGFNIDISEIALYKKAIEVEKKSATFYKEKAAEMENQEAKAMFLKISEDEEKHQFLLENMVEFLSRPISWIESAEFNHLDEY
jgi:rubrerythrin